MVSRQIALDVDSISRLDSRCEEEAENVTRDSPCVLFRHVLRDRTVTVFEIRLPCLSRQWLRERVEDFLSALSFIIGLFAIQYAAEQPVHASFSALIALRTSDHTR